MKFNKKMKNILIMFFLVSYLFASCKDFYTNKEVGNFKSGDTIYINVFYDDYLPAVVIKNDTVNELIHIKRPNYLDGNFEDFWMEEIVKYDKL